MELSAAARVVSCCGAFWSDGSSVAGCASAAEAGASVCAICVWSDEISREQRVKRDDGVPDLLELVDRGLLVGGGRFGLPFAEAARGGLHLIDRPRRPTPARAQFLARSPASWLAERAIRPAARAG